MFTALPTYSSSGSARRRAQVLRLSSQLLGTILDFLHRLLRSWRDRNHLIDVVTGKVHTKCESILRGVEGKQDPNVRLLPRRVRHRVQGLRANKRLGAPVALDFHPRESDGPLL